MPMNGGTRMLRARRKDINVKPNRRLDRKSSRGMLFENEELRMRTITINAEVEQGQHALKKLRRENEQLRREMWSLRDEYDKMEKLLRKKETDEDSDQENSYSDDNDSPTEESEDERGETTTDDGPTSESGAIKFGNLTTVRSFDGLSVIDEQTEETTTQTTESAIGCGTVSRGSSANRTLGLTVRGYEEGDFPPFHNPGYHSRNNQRKKVFPGYDSDSPAFLTYWPDNGYDVRPASPYPYAESVQPSYEKRFQVLQNLPPMLTTGTGENGWVFNPKTNYDVYQRDPFVEGPFIPDKSATTPISVQIPDDYTVIQDRAGPDVFICSNANVANPSYCMEDTRAETIGQVEADIDKIEISDKTEGEAKSPQTIADATKPNEEESTAMPASAKPVDSKGGLQCGLTENSVPCQNPGDKDVHQTIDNADMSKSSTFQSKLMVTLRTPGGKSDTRTAKRVPPVQVPRAYQTLGYGIKPEYQLPMGKRTAQLPSGHEANSSPMLEPLVDDIPVGHTQEDFGLLTEAAPLKPVKIPPAPPPRTSSCASPFIPEPPVGVTAVHHRTFRRAGRTDMNPLLLSSPIATSSPNISPRMLHRGHNLSLDNLSGRRKQVAAAIAVPNEESSTEDVSVRKIRTTSRSTHVLDSPHLNKSVSSPSFGTFLRRKPSEHSVSSGENCSILSPLAERKFGRGYPPNNVSVSSSSGLDSPTKSDRRKRRVSIKFNKRPPVEDGDERTSESRGDGALPGILTVKSSIRGRGRNRNEETDVTTSERERTNSISSRASSVAAGSGRRKLSISSNRTYVNDDKIPWCGCWGNGCV